MRGFSVRIVEKKMGPVRKDNLPEMRTVPFSLLTVIVHDFRARIAGRVSSALGFFGENEVLPPPPREFL